MIERRAEGRPPEEADSDDPSAQAEVILTESDERIRERASDADPAEGEERAAAATVSPMSSPTAPQSSLARAVLAAS